jgi:DNA-binding XRE family transcriptional regulator
VNLKAYRDKLLWTRAELQRRAGLNYETVTAAENGWWITPRTASKLINALNQGFKKVGGEEIELSQIVGLRIKGVTKV